MTETEKETRRAVAKIGYFQGHYQLGLIEYLEKELPEQFRFDVRGEINSELLRKIDEFDSLKFKDDVTIDEVNSLLHDFIVNHRDELCELRERLIELYEWPDD